MAEQEMTFWEHLDELRKVLFRSAIVIAVFMGAIFMAKDFVFNTVVFAPIDSDFILYRMIDKVLAMFNLPLLPQFHLEQYFLVI